MDIYCPRCGEPWDPDEFHDVAAEQYLTYDEVRRDFFARGCGLAFGGRQCTKVESVRAEASGMLAELLGGDMDGLAATLDDFDYLGMLD